MEGKANMSSMRILYSFEVEKIDEVKKREIVQYWKLAGFNLEKCENIFWGSRGSMFGNIISFDMRKLLCKCEIQFFDNKITTNLIINTNFQYITEWNVHSFILELLLSKTTLCHNQIPDWIPLFWKKTKKSELIWIFTLGIRGRKLDDICRHEFRELLNNDQLQIIKQ